jgi:hypothetical protein
MINPFFWISLISIIFWSIYHKWDEKRQNFVEHPVFTFWYFAFASFVILIFYPNSINYFRFEPLGIVFIIFVLGLIYFLFKILKVLFKGPQDGSWKFFDYYKILDEKYILPKLSEIVFQQTFFVSIMLISIESFSLYFVIFSVLSAFVLAHLNLFLFRETSEALFYLIFSFFGAPIFFILIVATGSIWFSVGFHLLFYAILSAFAWILTKVKY